jgi:hypothetical protein
VTTRKKAAVKWRILTVVVVMSSIHAHAGVTPIHVDAMLTVAVVADFIIDI